MSKLYKLNLQLFANANPQGTTTEALSVENKTFYSDYLIDNAMPLSLIHI